MQTKLAVEKKREKKSSLSVLKPGQNTPHFGAFSFRYNQHLVDFGRVDVEQWRKLHKTLLEGACVHSLQEATRNHFLFCGFRFLLELWPIFRIPGSA